jgi:hypothetical protein
VSRSAVAQWLKKVSEKWTKALRHTLPPVKLDRLDQHQKSNCYKLCSLALKLMVPSPILE